MFLVLAILGRQLLDVCVKFSRGFAEAGAGDIVVDLTVDDAQGVAEISRGRGLTSGLATDPVWLACPHACDVVGMDDGEVPYLSAGPA